MILRPPHGGAGEPPPAVPVWSPAQRIAFRCSLAYLVLFVPTLIGDFLAAFDLQRLPINALWRVVVPWTGTRVLRLTEPITVFTDGRGDTAFEYVQILLFALLAIVTAIIWSVADRRRTNHARLHHALRVGLRYALAYWMLLYAGVKIIKSQFPFPALDTLLTPYGQSSPFTLLWTMMGYSTLYTLYAGVVEAAAGVLLFWRRTTTLGALLVMAAMSNVVVLNLSYDIPVKIFSTHLFLMGLFLAAPGLRRVYDALVLGKAVDAERTVPHAGGREWRRIRLALKSLVVVGGVGGALGMGWHDRRAYGDGRVKPPLYGIWEVTDFTRNGQSVPRS